MKKIFILASVIIIICIFCIPAISKGKWVYLTENKNFKCYYHDPAWVYYKNYYSVHVKYIYTEKGKISILKKKEKQGIPTKLYVDFAYGIDAYLIDKAKKRYLVLEYTDFTSTDNVITAEDFNYKLDKLKTPEKLKWKKIHPKTIIDEVYNKVKTFKIIDIKKL